MKFVPFTDPKAESWTYLNWKQVIPNCTVCKELEFRGGSVNVEQDIFLLQFSHASHGTGALIAQEFIDLLCKTGLTYTVRVIDGMSPVVFECGTFFSFVVMPRRDRGKSATAEIIAGFKEDVIREWKATLDASEGRQRIDPVDAEPMSEEPTAQDAGSDVKPEPQDEPQQQDEPKQQKKTRKRKPSFAYVCELESGETITLNSTAEVEARGDVVKCNIEPAKKCCAA